MACGLEAACCALAVELGTSPPTHKTANIWSSRARRAAARSPDRLQLLDARRGPRQMFRLCRSMCTWSRLTLPCVARGVGVSGGVEAPSLLSALVQDDQPKELLVDARNACSAVSRSAAVTSVREVFP